MTDEPFRNRIVGHGVKPADQFLANPANFRKHPQNQRAAMRGVLEELGWIDDVKVNLRTSDKWPAGERGVETLVDGHERVWQALQAGNAMVPYKEVDLTPKEEAKALATFDAITGLAEIDPAAFADVLRDVDTGNAAIQEMLSEMAEGVGVEWGVLAEPEEPPEPQIDRAAELQAQWGTERGQVWEILSKTVPGKSHRVMCGDSTDEADVGRMMDEATPVAIVTDPPYGQNQEGVPGDDPKELDSLVHGAIAAFPSEDMIYAIFQSPRTFPIWLDAARAAGHRFERMLWMYKAAQCTFPWRGWILKSESILLFSTGSPQWQDEHPYTHDCYYLAELSGEIEESLGWHGSIKPIKVVSDLIQRICAKGLLVLDGFLGSGTTLVAAEQIGRLCYGMDIYPPYVAVTLQRLSDMGLEPRLVLDVTPSSGYDVDSP